METAIVISAFTMGLGVIRALGREGVPVIVLYYDARDMGQRSKYVREALRCPHPAQHEADFIAFLLDHAGHLQNGVIFPASDAALTAVSRHKPALATCYRVACAEWDVVERIIDKKYTYQLADEIGVPAPKTHVPVTAEDVERFGATCAFPCLVKPSQSHLFYAEFHQKMVQVDNVAQMANVFQRATEAGLEVLLQELITGGDDNGVNYNAYVAAGEARVEFTAQKVRNAPPSLGSPRVAISRHIPDVLEPGRRILHALGFEGYACTEFKRDARDGVYKLMEVNGRHNLSTLLAVRCGLNFPWLHYRHLVYDELPDATRFEEGVYWIDLVRDVGYSLKHRRQEPFSWRDYVTPYAHRRVFAVWDVRDWRPFVKRCTDLVKTGDKS